MELPIDGKVIIIDDSRSEVEPLIDILSQKRIPHVYFTGSLVDLPQEPLSGIRVIFLDLRFGPVIDEKTIVGNACALLNKVIGENNGPFLLITWSSTGTDHHEGLKSALKSGNINPEAIVSLSKADFFAPEYDDLGSTISGLRNIIADNANLDTVEEKLLMDKIENYLYSRTDESKKVFIKEKFDLLTNEIDKAMEEAGVLPLFVVWENAVQNAASTTVSNVYQAVPNTVLPQKRLMAVANSLSRNVLEKRYEKATSKERLQAAFQELNDIFTHFYESETSNLESTISIDLKYGNEMDLKSCSAKLNSWKLIRKVGKKETPGRVFVDENQLFDWKSFAKYEDTIDEAEKKKPSMEEIKSYVEYIYMNINGECETVQKKAKWIKIVPGIIVNKEFFSSKYNVHDLVNRDDLMLFGPFEYEKHDSYMIFSLAQCRNIDLSALDAKSIFILNRKYYQQVRQKIASSFSKQGSDLY